MMIKKKASVFLKRMVSLVSSIAKAKAMAAKTKTSAIKARLLLSSLMENKKLLVGSISDKLHTILRRTQDEEEQSNSIILYSSTGNKEGECSSSSQMVMDDYDEEEEEEEEEDKYPDLTHCLFDEEEEFDDDDDPGSIIDMLKHSKEEQGQDFSLEKEIDHVADLFIMRFHKQMRLQKLQSFKRLQAMLDRSL